MSIARIAAATLAAAIVALAVILATSADAQPIRFPGRRP